MRMRTRIDNQHHSFQTVRAGFPLRIRTDRVKSTSPLETESPPPRHCAFGHHSSRAMRWPDMTLCLFRDFYSDFHQVRNQEMAVVVIAVGEVLPKTPTRKRPSRYQKRYPCKIGGAPCRHGLVIPNCSLMVICTLTNSYSDQSWKKQKMPRKTYSRVSGHCRMDERAPSGIRAGADPEKRAADRSCARMEDPLRDPAPCARVRHKWPPLREGGHVPRRASCSVCRGPSCP